MRSSWGKSCMSDKGHGRRNLNCVLTIHNEREQLQQDSPVSYYVSFIYGITDTEVVHFHYENRNPWF